MNQNVNDQFWSGIMHEEDLKGAIRIRKDTYLIQNIAPQLTEKYQTEGWEIDKVYKTKTRVKKVKPLDIAFEDEVWSTFASLGFTHLNKNRKFCIPYSDDANLTQQIDVFAADDETILIIECKASGGEPKKGNFKEAIEAIGGKKEGILKVLKSLFPGSKHKVKFIFATKNYVLSESDKDRLVNYDILHFDEEIIKYYQELTKHLGLSARYQLLGFLFEGQSIPAINNQIPAIQGKMGGYSYYSFSIEPEKLLKIGYVLHRNKANKKMMPTYQRLIKKARLKSVETFIEEGGFFPNSIVININANGKKLRFDQSSLQEDGSISKIGILHLPKIYRSAFIIDGQHRLYGYANSQYKNKNSIPVVAFIDLDRKEQVKLFMQINENQKAVSKNLRNTLNSDLLWDSDSFQDRIKALKLQIALDLGEELSSPLYDRVIIGENLKTVTRCITIDTIKAGLDRSNFFGNFSKNSIKADGTFFKGDNDETYDILFPFLEECFDYIKQNMSDDWSKGENSDGYLAINPGIESLIRIFSDIVDHLVKREVVKPKSDKLDKVIAEVTYYLQPLVSNLKTLTAQQKSDLRKSYGTGGRAKYWRTLQRIINKERPDFIPPGLETYWNDEAKRFNTQSIEMIRDIETHFKEDFKQLLENFYGINWFKKGVPVAVQESSTIMAVRKNAEIENKDEEKEPWDCLNIIDYRKIATFGSNWRDVFESLYTEPGVKRGNKDEKTNWMVKLEKIRNQNFHEYSVKEDEFNFLCLIHKWLIEDKND